MTTALATLAQGQQATTTSLVVAEKFAKNHRDVLRAIRNLECSPEFHQRNFAPMTYLDSAGKGAQRQQPAFEITKNGFAFLAMGFTGPEAAQWKERFIDAFDFLESAWKTQPLAQLALRELHVRQRAEGLHIAQQGYVSGLLQGGCDLYLNALQHAESLLNRPPQIAPQRPTYNSGRIKRSLKPRQRDALQRDLQAAEARGEPGHSVIEAHARRLGLTPRRLAHLFNHAP